VITKGLSNGFVSIDIYWEILRAGCIRVGKHCLLPAVHVSTLKHSLFAATRSREIQQKIGWTSLWRSAKVEVRFFQQQCYELMHSFLQRQGPWKCDCLCWLFEVVLNSRYFLSVSQSKPSSLPQDESCFQENSGRFENGCYEGVRRMQAEKEEA